MAVERKGNIVFCLRFMLKLLRENKSAAAPIHAHSNDKKGSRFEDQKVHVIAVLSTYYIHQLVFIYFLERSYHDYLVKQNCVVNKIWTTKSTRRKCLK